MRTLPPLDPWVELLDLSLPDDRACHLVRLAQPPDAPGEVEVGVLPLGELHPAEVLDGFEAPEEWFALGVVATGWGAPDDGSRPSTHPRRRRVISTVLVDRAGHVAGRIRFASGEVIAAPPEAGEVLELLRRALGLAPSAVSRSGAEP
jgi:hypothetical protein